MIPKTTIEISHRPAITDAATRGRNPFFATRC